MNCCKFKIYKINFVNETLLPYGMDSVTQLHSGARIGAVWPTKIIPFVWALSTQHRCGADTSAPSADQKDKSRTIGGGRRGPPHLSRWRPSPCLEQILSARWPLSPLLNHPICGPTSPICSMDF